MTLMRPIGPDGQTRVVAVEGVAVLAFGLAGQEGRGSRPDRRLAGQSGLGTYWPVQCVTETSICSVGVRSSAAFGVRTSLPWPSTAQDIARTRRCGARDTSSSHATASVPSGPWSAHGNHCVAARAVDHLRLGDQVWPPSVVRTA